MNRKFTKIRDRTRIADVTAKQLLATGYMHKFPV